MCWCVAKSQAQSSLPNSSHSRSMDYSITIAGSNCLPEVLPQPTMVNPNLNTQPPPTFHTSHKYKCHHTGSIPFVYPRLSHISSNSPRPIAAAPSHELLALPEVQWMKPGNNSPLSKWKKALCFGQTFFVTAGLFEYIQWLNGCNAQSFLQWMTERMNEWLNEWMEGTKNTKNKCIHEWMCKQGQNRWCQFQCWVSGNNPHQHPTLANWCWATTKPHHFLRPVVLPKISSHVSANLRFFQHFAYSTLPLGSHPQDKLKEKSAHVVWECHSAASHNLTTKKTQTHLPTFASQMLWNNSITASCKNHPVLARSECKGGRSSGRPKWKWSQLVSCCHSHLTIVP